MEEHDASQNDVVYGCEFLNLSDTDIRYLGVDLAGSDGSAAAKERLFVLTGFVLRARPVRSHALLSWVVQGSRNPGAADAEWVTLSEHVKDRSLLNATGEVGNF